MSATNRTRPTGENVRAFLDAVEPPGRRVDAQQVLQMMQEVAGCSPRMWGPSLVGFGEYHYRYESGREGDFFRLGFSPRKAKMVVYLMPYYEGFGPLLEQLGPHKLGKSCLYLGRLAKLDLEVLRALMQMSWTVMAERYPPA